MLDRKIVDKLKKSAFFVEKRYFQYFFDFSLISQQSDFAPVTKNDQHKNLYKMRALKRELKILL